MPSNHTTSTQSVRVNNITTHLYKSDTPSRETQVIIMRLRSQNTLQFSNITSYIDGADLGDLLDTWKDMAVSEARLKRITVLKNKNLGFNEIQQFELGLRYNLRSDRMQEKSEKPLLKVIQAAMEVKRRDEIHRNKELTIQREEKKKWLARIHHPKTKPYKKVIQYLRQESEKEKEIHNRKYWAKIHHLEERYRKEKEEKKIPPGMENLSHLAVFDEEAYMKIERNRIQVPIIGEIELTEEEKSIIRKNPKFAIPERLLEDTLRQDMKKAYSLMRMELRDGEELIQEEKRARIQLEEEEEEKNKK